MGRDDDHCSARLSATAAVSAKHRRHLTAEQKREPSCSKRSLKYLLGEFYPARTNCSCQNHNKIATFVHFADGKVNDSNMMDTIVCPRG